MLCISNLHWSLITLRFANINLQNTARSSDYFTVCRLASSGLSTMAMFSTNLAVLLVCCALPLLVSAAEISEYTINALALFNGDFNNQKQVDEPGNENAFIQYKAVPVDAPALSSGPVIYEEWAANGVVESRVILLVSEQPGPSIRMDIYNFTHKDLSYYKPGEFNVSLLRNLKLKDLRGGNCTATYKRLTNLVLVGYYPDCRVLIEGNYPGLGDTFTCNAYGAVLPPTDLSFSTTPYILNRIGDRYPLFGFPDNFNKICGQKKYPKKTRPKYQ